MFTAPFTSTFIVVSHDSQTYGPRSTRLLSRICPQHEHVFAVFSSSTRSTALGPIRQRHNQYEHQISITVGSPLTAATEYLSVPNASNGRVFTDYYVKKRFTPSSDVGRAWNTHATN